MLHPYKLIRLSHYSAIFEKFFMLAMDALSQLPCDVSVPSWNRSVELPVVIVPCHQQAPFCQLPKVWALGSDVMELTL